MQRDLLEATLPYLLLSELQKSFLWKCLTKNKKNGIL